LLPLVALGAVQVGAALRRRLTATMTIIRINDPSRLELLLSDLRTRPDVVAEIIAPDRIRVNILGSYNLDAMRLAILLRIRAWEAAQRAHGFDVEVDLEY
jgi:hypothetical protein